MIYHLTLKLRIQACNHYSKDR